LPGVPGPDWQEADVRRFELLEPESFTAASAALLEHPEAKAIAGGTALLILIKHGVYVPELLVNLRKIQGMADISWDPAKGLRIGALASINDVERSPLVREHLPMLAEACHVVANIRIRNLATIGGNVSHGDYQSDPPTALVALGAVVELTSATGRRELPLADFLLGAYETALEPGELVSAVRVPPPGAGWRTAYLKFTTRSSEDRPAVGVAALLRMDGGTVREARLVVGAVTTTPSRMTDVEAYLAGRPLDPGTLAEVGRLVSGSIEPIDDIRGSAAYKRRLAGVQAERALELCSTMGAAR
jgi:carbon-monoxide dehydrogenase medium subunit